MSEYVGTARSLYLELRALGLRLHVEDDPDGVSLDYELVVDGLRSLPDANARSARQCIRRNKEGLILLLLDRRDPDLDAVRREGHCR